MTDKRLANQPLLVSAFFPPDELDAIVVDMKSTTLELTPEEAQIFEAIEKTYYKFVVHHICHAAQLIQHLRPNVGIEEITYSGVMTMLAMFEMHLRRGQEARKI